MRTLRPSTLLLCPCLCVLAVTGCWFLNDHDTSAGCWILVVILAPDSRTTTKHLQKPFHSPPALWLDPTAARWQLPAPLMAGLIHRSRVRQKWLVLSHLYLWCYTKRHPLQKSLLQMVNEMHLNMMHLLVPDSCFLFLSVFASWGNLSLS